MTEVRNNNINLNINMKRNKKNNTNEKQFVYMNSNNIIKFIYKINYQHLLSRIHLNDMLIFFRKYEAMIMNPLGDQRLQSNIRMSRSRSRSRSLDNYFIELIIPSIKKTYKYEIDFLIPGITEYYKRKLELSMCQIEESNNNFQVTLSTGQQDLNSGHLEEIFDHETVNDITWDVDALYLEHLQLLYENENQYEYMQEVPIDPMNEDLDSLMESYKNKDPGLIRYMYRNISNDASGNGANRMCKTILLKRVVEKYFKKTSRWFIEPSWHSKIFEWSNIKPLTSFIKSCIAAKILLPQHLSPRIIEIMISRKFTVEELLYYLNLIDPVVHKHVTQLNEILKTNPCQFNEICPGYESFETMLRDKVIGPTLGESENMIISYFDFAPIEYEDVIQLDQMISEPYEITNQMIIDVFKINDDMKYQQMWNEMIEGMIQTELRSMLIMFTGTGHITEPIELTIDHTMFCDLDIHACDHKGTIHSRLFDSQDTLDGLKLYFSDTNDVMNDKNQRRVQTVHNIIQNNDLSDSDSESQIIELNDHHPIHEIHDELDDELEETDDTDIENDNDIAEPKIDDEPLIDQKLKRKKHKFLKKRKCEIL